MQREGTSVKRLYSFGALLLVVAAGLLGATGSAASAATCPSGAACVSDVASLVAAVDAANAGTGASTIVLAPGAYQLGESDQLPQITAALLTIEGSAAGAAVIDGGGSDYFGNGIGVFEHQGGDLTLQN